jgi:hypothetical protein
MAMDENEVTSCVAAFLRMVREYAGRAAAARAAEVMVQSAAAIVCRESGPERLQHVLRVAELWAVEAAAEIEAKAEVRH